MDKQDCSYIMADIVFNIFQKMDEIEQLALAKVLYKTYVENRGVAEMETPISSKVVDFKGYTGRRRGRW